MYNFLSRIILTFSLFLSVCCVYGQTFLFQETFDEANGSNSGVDNTANNVAWSSTCPSSENAQDYFDVRNGKLEGRDTNGEAVFTTDPIDISTAPEGVVLRATFSESGDMEECTPGCEFTCLDWVRFEWRVDGGPWILHPSSVACTNASAGSSYILLGNMTQAQETFTSNCITGNSLEIRIAVANWAANEYWRIDDVEVFAEENTGQDTTISTCDSSSFSLFSVLGSDPLLSNSGVWSGPSPLSGGYIGTFTPSVNASGIYTYSLPNNRCPSSTNVTVNSILLIEDTVNVTACDSIQNEGVWYFNDTTLIDSFTTISGCDSVLRTIITVNQSSVDTVYITTCDFYVFNGDTLYVSGNYTSPNLPSSSGCDSMVYLDLTIANSIPNWNKIGLDLDGVSNGDQFGYATSINGDGTIVAAGARYNDGGGNNSGHVRVYQWNGSSWAQLGGDINGENSIDQSGYAVSLSSDGFRIAIGAINNDGGGNNAGHTRVYEFDGAAWVQLGSDIDGESASDNSGYDVRLSGDGSRLAISSPKGDLNGSNSGEVRVFEYDGVNWIQMGANLNGENAADEFGTSISLDYLGSNIVVGAPFNDNNGLNTGYVKVYQWNGISWLQRGSEINGSLNNDNAGFDVDINRNGNTIALGIRFSDVSASNAGEVKVYDWDGASWVQKGGSLLGDAANDWYGYSVAISSDGNRLAASAHFNDDNGSNSGHVKAYGWDGNIWSQLDVSIAGENSNDQSGYSIDMSDNGTTLVIGAPYNDDNGNNSGHIRVYQGGGIILEPTRDTTYQASCNNYQWGQNGLTYSSSGFYNDTLLNVLGCDSAIQTLGLTIYNDTITTNTIIGCDSILFEGVYFYSDTILYDTLNTSAGCDSVIVSEIEFGGAGIPTAVCQQVTSVYLDSNGLATLTAIAIDNGSYDDCSVDTLLLDRDSFFCGDISQSPLTVTLTAVDGAGNSNSCTSLVSVFDTIQPVAICNDITVYLDSFGQASVVPGDIDAGSYGNCLPLSTTISQSLFDCEASVETVTLTVTDINLNQNTCTANVTVIDTIAPLITCLDTTLYLDSAGVNFQTPETFIQTASDNCFDSLITISSSQSLFTCADIVQQIPLPPSLTLWINEIHYDNVGTDQDEFIEIAGTANADLTGYTLVLYNGSNGSVYDTQVLNGSLSDDGNGFGYFVVNYPSNGIQNGPDGIALIDPNGVPVEYFAYEGNFIATDGPLIGLNFFEINAEESGSTPIGFSIQRNGTGSQGIDFIGDTVGSSTPGSVNIGQVLLNYTLNPISINLIAQDVSGNQSTCTVEVTVLDTVNRNEVRTFESCGSVLFNGISYSSDTVLIDTIQSTNGCDSTITTILNVLEINNTSLAPISSCPPYLWQGQTITQSGLYTDTLTSSNGCDSILSIDVTIIEPPVVSINIDSPISCVGDNDAEISAVITGGVPPYLADWSIDGLGDFDDGIIQVNVGEGFYSVQIEDASGCRSNTVSIDLFDPELITVFSTSFPELEGSSIDITIIGGSPPFTFDWNNDGIGDNDDPEDLVLASPNAYSVIVTDANGCTAFFSDTIDLGGYPTSIIHVDGLEVSLFPNPTNGMVNVLYQPVNNENMLLEILDIQGRLIQSKRLHHGGMVQFNLSHLPDGTYLARFSQQHLVKEVTIIKAE